METNLSLKNKVAIVTGAGTGIGEAIALKFARLGAAVVCAGLPGDPVEDVAKTIVKRRSKALAFEGDLSNPVEADACVRYAVESFGKLDILVCNAGVYLVGDTTENISDDAFFRTLQGNIATAFFMTRAALPALKKSRGTILTSGSVAGLKGEPGNSVYGGSKAFLHAFMQALAVEQAPHGIRVNCVLPGAIDTAMTRSTRSPMSKKEERTMTAGIPMRRRGTPEEVANVFAFLASDLATYVNGALWPVDGAYTTGWGEAEEVPARIRKKPKGSLARALRHSRDGGFKTNNPPPRN
jgi:NAD(P)-dependent dehydrogenase (short-subunit alcohol dehydrogenase family)